MLVETPSGQQLRLAWRGPSAELLIDERRVSRRYGTYQTWVGGLRTYQRHPSAPLRLDLLYRQTATMTDAVDRQTRLVRETGARGRTTIFLHIGKTAGTTLAAVLRQRYHGRAVFTYDSNDPQSASDQLERLDPTQLGRLRLVRGHLLFGIHAHLPQPALYISLLRDPRARLESTYRHMSLRSRHTAYTSTRLADA